MLPFPTTSPDTPWATLTDLLSYIYLSPIRFRNASKLPIPLYFFTRIPSWYKYSPGDSSVPAKSDPNITADAPNDNAFVILPEELIPPSAIIGIPTS